MADRRMLWKTVSQSKKLNKISIPAALLWTWCIPWFDRDGYMEAEPDFIKWNVMPRRLELDESSITPLIQEIIDSGLWISFFDEEGKLIVKEMEFNEHQRIEYKKEMKSKWEGKKLIATSDRRVIDECSLQDKIKGREGKLIEGKEGEYEGKPNPQLDTPQKPKDALSEKLTDQEKRQIEILAYKIQTHYGKKFSIQMWIQNNIRLNPKTHLHVMNRIVEKWPPSPIAYADKIASIEEGNYNEKESITQHQENKSIFTDILKSIKKIQGGV